MNKVLGFIGAGHIARSLIGGLIANHYPASSIWVSNPNWEKINTLKQAYGVHVSDNNEKVAKEADVIILAVKPDTVPLVAQQIRSIIAERSLLIISLAAGVQVKNLSKWLGDHQVIVRCMPNLPVYVGKGATALFANTFVSKEDQSCAESIMRSVGIVAWLQDEDLMDVVTALSGSGPAYFYLIMSVIEKVAVKSGLDEKTAHLFLLQTVLGSAQMALQSEESIDSLRQQITSPGGTTEQAIKVLEHYKVPQIFTEAFEAALIKAKTLAHELLNKT